MNRKRTILVLFIVLVSTVSVYADMMPVSQSAPAVRQADNERIRTALSYTDYTCAFSLELAPSSLNSQLKIVSRQSAIENDVAQIQQTKSFQILTEGQSSLSLCVYALIGLGLCQAAPWVKKLSFGFIPEWYLNGGPFQIGHSLAVTPETLYPTPACCFIQPACAVELIITQYRLRTIMSLWRKSQFTLDVIASRGPPWRS